MTSEATTSPCKPFMRLSTVASQALKVETIRVEVRRVLGGGESAWAAVESLCTATSKYGKSLFTTRHLSASLGPYLSDSNSVKSRNALLFGICGLGSVQLAREDCPDEGVFGQRAYSETHRTPRRGEKIVLTLDVNAATRSTAGSEYLR